METIQLIINTSRDGEEKQHKAFLKSLGIKSDSVGWCELNLDAPDTKEKLEKIIEYAKSIPRSIRIWYYYKEDFTDTDWYLYDPKDLSVDISAWKDVKVPSKRHIDGWTTTSVRDGILAYKIPKNIHIIHDNELKATSAIVSENFKTCVETNGLTGVQFVWARDKGRYQAPDYYRAVNADRYDENNIFVSVTNYHGKIRTKRKCKYGPNWSWLSELNIILDHLSVPPLFKGEVPKNDITEKPWGFIFSKRAANCLLDAKLISKADLSPCRFVNEVPEYYDPMTKHYGSGTEVEDDEIQTLTLDEILEIQKEYEKFSKKSRPIREVKQKDVLKELKSKKRENPDSFAKPLKKSVRETLIGTSFEVLLPYLSVADGIYADELEMLSYKEMCEATNEYLEEKQGEETISILDGIQIAVSSGGDYIILTPEKVVRYSHEDWSIENEWSSIDLFISEMLDEIE